jgi:hypothetical protein
VYVPAPDPASFGPPVEKALRLQPGRVGFEAVVPNPKLKMLGQVHEVMRLRHYLIRKLSEIVIFSAHLASPRKSSARRHSIRSQNTRPIQIISSLSELWG